METSTTSPVGLLEECCICGEVAPLGDFATSAVSGKSYCEKHTPELLAEVRGAK